MKWTNLYAILLTILFNSTLLVAQQAIDITEQTVKLLPLQNEKIYFALAKGDELIISIDVLNNNNLRKIELLAYPHGSIYSDYSVSSLKEKSFKLTQEGVYVLILNNGYFKPSISKVKIKRRPEFESNIYFNTQVRWETQEKIIHKNKTQKQIVGYDTIYTESTNRVANKIVYKEEMILNKSQRVNARIKPGAPTSDVRLELPKNEISENRIKKIKGWSYWIGVGEEAAIAWEKNVENFSNLAKTAVTFLGGGPLTAFALGALPTLVMPNIGEDVEYSISLVDTTDYVDNDPYDYKVVDITRGKGIATFGKNDKDLQGEINIHLANDNYMQDINVEVKIAILWEEQTFDVKESKDMKIVPKYENKAVSNPKIKKIKVPVY